MKDKIKKYPIKRKDVLYIYVDGASRGNKGPVSWSFLYVNKDNIFFRKSDYIGI